MWGKQSEDSFVAYINCGFYFGEEEADLKRAADEDVTGASAAFLVVFAVWIQEHGAGGD